jgi:hypothetical protein
MTPFRCSASQNATSGRDPTTLVAETAVEIADIFVRAVMGEKA